MEQDYLLKIVPNKGKPSNNNGIFIATRHSSNEGAYMKEYRSDITKPKQQISGAGQPCRANLAILRDIQSFTKMLRSKGLYTELQQLQQIKPHKAFVGIAGDWLLIFIAWWLTAFVSFYFFPISVLIIGNRQRALGNILHDAGHIMLAKSKSRNDLIAELLLALPLFNRITWYWQLHKCHHSCLGFVPDDPDFIHAESYRNKSWQEVLGEKVFSRSTWLSSTLGHLPALPWKSRIPIVSWWVVFLGIMFMSVGSTKSVIFFILWMVSGATIFHIITRFREISDHVGLVPGSVVGFTRNNPTTSLLRFFFHPHNNGYHLAHHLAYRIPYYALPEAHRLFLNCNEYTTGHHCDGYFFGEHSVVACWTGKCKQANDIPTIVLTTVQKIPD